jgi:hypothetical protein
VTKPEPRWFVAAERLGVARALQGICRPGDLLLAPPDIGIYATGLASCGSYVSHGAAPGFEARLSAVQRFYSAETTAEDRAAFLARLCVTHVVLPPTAEECPVAVLGHGTPFCRTAGAVSGGRALAVYSRRGAAGCASSAP